MSNNLKRDAALQELKNYKEIILDVRTVDSNAPLDKLTSLIDAEIIKIEKGAKKISNDFRGSLLFRADELIAYSYSLSRQMGKLFREIREKSLMGSSEASPLSNSPSKKPWGATTSNPQGFPLEKKIRILLDEVDEALAKAGNKSEELIQYRKELIEDRKMVSKRVIDENGVPQYPSQTVKKQIDDLRPKYVRKEYHTQKMNSILQKINHLPRSEHKEKLQDIKSSDDPNVVPSKNSVK